MAKIPLRTYNREIEGMIDRGQAAQAIDHGQHILKFFPKHIDTYRLLGKAFLELQRYPEAADVLQRVLSCVPDDFISQIGMGIIREDESNLDAAIWHMERAFEAQPSNVGVQDELRRLYGKRDGVQPVKIRLTRGALVRMYARGELYQQAIAEIRAALVEDPQRVDLEVILARMYFLSGQKVAATEVCTRLLNKLPFCFEANRILSEILPESARAEDAKNYLQRVYAMDPYLEHISTSAPSTAEVPDNAIEVDHLEWLQGQEVEPTQDWSKSLGIDWKDQAAPVPDWVMSGSQDPVKAPEPEPESQITEPPQAESDASGAATAVPPFESTFEEPAQEEPMLNAEGGTDIPDWMKQAGWVPAGDEPAEEIPEEIPTEDVNETEMPAAGIEQAEIPEWLAAMEPPEPSEVAETADTESIDWLKSILPTESESPSARAEESEGLEQFPAEEAMPFPYAEDIPSTEAPEESAFSIENLTEPEGIESSLQFDEEQPVSPIEDFPPFVESFETPDEETALVPGAFISDEITETPFAEEVPAPPSAFITNEPEFAAGEGEIQAPFSGETPAELTSDEEVPSTMAFLTDEPTDTPTEEEPQFSDWLGKLESPREEIPGVTTGEPGPWISELAPESTPETAGGTEGELPDWLFEAAAPPSEIEHGESQADSILGDTQPTRIKREEPSTPIPESFPEAPIPEDEIDESLSWLERLTPQESSAEAFTPEPAESSSEEIPDYLQEIRAEDAWHPVDAQPAVDAETDHEAQLENIEEDASSVFEGLSAELETSEPEIVSGESLPEETVSELQGLEPEAEQGLPPSQMGEEAAFAWLDSLAASHSEGIETSEPEPEKPADEIPEWFKEAVDAPGSEAAETTEQEQFLSSFESTTEDEAPVETVLPEFTTDVPSFDTDAELTLPEKAQEVESLAEESIPEQVAESLSVEPEPAAPEEPLPAWLQAIVAEEQKQAASLPEATTPIEEPAAAEPLGWLQDLEKEEPTAAETPAESPKLEDTSPIKIQPAFKEEESILEPASPVEADALPEWLRGVDEEKAAEEPLQEFSLEGAPGEVAGEDTGSEWRPEIPTGVSEQEPSVAAPIDNMADQPSEFLKRAQEALEAHNIDRALEHYDRLVQSGQYLDETIHDLRDALYSYPIDPAIWQSLGDAYMKSNHLQDALDAYTKAEELLR